MVYCTIEEAWTQNLNPELQQEQEQSLDYEPNQVDDLFEVNKVPKLKTTRVPQKSRTFATLDGHSSKKNRQRKKIKKVFIDNTKESDNTSLESDSYNLLDPSNEFNLQAFNEYNSRSKDLDSNMSVMEDFQENIPNYHKKNIGQINNIKETDNSDNFIKIINELRAENKRMNETIDSLRNNSNSNKDNFMEIAMFIITGIIIILMMENINKLVRRF